MESRARRVSAPSSNALAGVPRLAERPVVRGERWIFSAGFNVRPDLASTARIDCELDDLARLLGAGARVAILSHQGSYKSGSAGSLGFAAAYLSRRLDRNIRYIDACCGADAEARAAALAPGEAALFGNTRFLAGEESNDAELARAFARLGDFVAVGGFSKAHRAHASNVGVLRYRPGYAAESLAREIECLAPWAGVGRGLSLAILGGSKQEKITVGLEGFTRLYDFVVPAGTVLSCLLKASGHEVGGSDLGEHPERGVEAARAILGRANRARIAWPDRILIARRTLDGYRAPRALSVGSAVPADHAIVDIVVGPALQERLRWVASSGGRLLLAGTPGLVSCGFREGSEMCAAALMRPGARSIVVGGDSAADLAFRGRISTGGGAALQYLVANDAPVLAALRAAQAPAVREVRS